VAGGAPVDVRHAPGEEEAARQVERVLPAARGAAERWGSLDPGLTVVVHASNEELARAAGRPGATWLRGWARPDRVDLQSPRAWTRGYASDEALRSLLAHELTHCVLFRLLGPGWARRDVPAWFEEGMASYTAGERHDPAAALPAPAEAGPRRAYADADAAFRRIVQGHGEDGVRRILAGLARGLPFPEAFREATGEPAAAFAPAAAGRDRVAALPGVTASSTPR
jgi:hypothetical protein